MAELSAFSCSARGQDHAAARAAQGLVGGGGHEVGDADRRWIVTGGDQPGVVGRVDQYLYPYYKKDLDAGKITRSKAREMLGSFLVKFNERVQLNNDHIEDHFSFGDWSQGGDPDLETTHLKMSNDMPYTYGQSSNHWLQNCVVSGLTPEGKDGTNDISIMVIELVNELDLIDPLVSVRLHKDSPKEILEVTAKFLAKGGAQPTVFNDDVVIPGMVKYLGIPIEDARDYSNDGCWETIPYGKTEFGYGHIEVLLSLESLLNRGKSFLNGNHIGPDLGDPENSPISMNYSTRLRSRSKTGSMWRLKTSSNTTTKSIK